MAHRSIVLAGKPLLLKFMSVNSQYIIRKHVCKNRFIYYLEDVKIDKETGDFIYTWNGLRNNAIFMSYELKETYLKDLDEQFEDDNFSSTT